MARKRSRAEGLVGPSDCRASTSRPRANDDAQTDVGKLEWHGAIRQPHYVSLMLCEETLEMLGSLLFAVGFTLLAQAQARRVRARRGPSRARVADPAR